MARPDPDTRLEEGWSLPDDSRRMVELPAVHTGGQTPSSGVTERHGTKVGSPIKMFLSPTSLTFRHDELPLVGGSSSQTDGSIRTASSPSPPLLDAHHPISQLINPTLIDAGEGASRRLLKRTSPTPSLGFYSSASGSGSTTASGEIGSMEGVGEGESGFDDVGERERARITGELAGMALGVMELGGYAMHGAKGGRDGGNGARGTGTGPDWLEGQRVGSEEGRKEKQGTQGSWRDPASPKSGVAPNGPPPEIHKTSPSQIPSPALTPSAESAQYAHLDPLTAHLRPLNGPGREPSSERDESVSPLSLSPFSPTRMQGMSGSTSGVIPMVFAGMGSVDARLGTRFAGGLRSTSSDSPSRTSDTPSDLPPPHPIVSTPSYSPPAISTTPTRGTTSPPSTRTSYRPRLSTETFHPPQSTSWTVTSPTSSAADSDKTVTPSMGGSVLHATSAGGRSGSESVRSASDSSGGRGVPGLKVKKPPPLSLPGVAGGSGERVAEDSPPFGGQTGRDYDLIRTASHGARHTQHPAGMCQEISSSKPRLMMGRAEATGDDISHANRTIGQNELVPVPPTAISFASRGAGSEDLPLDVAKLDLLGELIRHGFNELPISREGHQSVSSSVSTNGQSSLPASPPFVHRMNAQCVSRNELLERVGALSVADGTLARNAPRFIIVDSRPLPAFLASHLAHSVALAIPSVVLRRCRNFGGSKFQGGWAALQSCLATEGSRNAWRDASGSEQSSDDKGAVGSQVELVVLGSCGDNQGEGDLGVVLESILQALHTGQAIPFRHCTNLSIRRSSLSWLDIKEDPRFAPHLREGERSLPKTGGATLPQNVESILRAGPASPPQNLSSPLPNFPKSAGPEQTTFGAIPWLPPPPVQVTHARHPPARHPSMPSLRISVPTSHSPPPIAKRRPPPSPMRIDTSGTTQRSVSMGQPGSIGKTSRPPKLNLNMGSLRSVTGPMRSATLGAIGSHSTDPVIGAANRSGTISRVDLLQGQISKQSRSPGSPRGGERDHPSPDFAYPIRTARPFAGFEHDSFADRDSVTKDSPPEPSHDSQSSYAMPFSEGSTAEGGPARPPGFVVSTVLPGFLYLGPEPTSEAEVQNLLALGIKRILNVALECEIHENLHLAERFEKYAKLGLRDSIEETGIGKGVRDACKYLDDARLHSAPTYVHCRAGKSRSVTVVLGYLIHANAWTFKTAYAYVSERRQGISPNIGFVAELMHFEQEELGLNRAQVTDTEGRGGPGSPKDAGGKRNKYARESMPSMYANGLDLSALRALTIGSNGSSEGISRARDPDGAQAESPRGNGHEGGTEKEVRKNGQYVHQRRAPVNEYTLQPTRRVSKAGLEGLSGWTSPLLSPGSIAIERSRTPEGKHAAGWL